MIRWLGAHPIVGFLVLTFAISYLIGLPALFAYSAWAPDQPPVLRTYLSRVLVVYGPALAAILMAAVAHGRTGAAALLRRLIPRPGDLPWALVILLTGVATSGLALAHAGVSAAQLTAAVDSASALLVVHFLLQILIVSVGEELGWRGWLLPRLMERTSRLRATLMVAAAWGLWHGPLLISDMRTTLLFLLAVLGLSLLFTWIWVHTGQRLFLVVLTHATVNAPLFFWDELAQLRGWSAGAVPSAWYALESMYALAGCGLVLLTRHWWLQRTEPAVVQASPGTPGHVA